MVIITIVALGIIIIIIIITDILYRHVSLQIVIPDGTKANSTSSEILANLFAAIGEMT